MKNYILEPKNKKAITEITKWVKEDEFGKYEVHHEVEWRTGSFSISVPETIEEKALWASEHGMTVDSLDSHKFLPNSDDELINMDDYYAEMIECNDGTYQEYSLVSYPDDADEELVDEINDGLEDDPEDFLEDNGWEDIEFSISIEGGVIITSA